MNIQEAKQEIIKKYDIPRKTQIVYGSELEEFSEEEVVEEIEEVYEEVDAEEEEEGTEE